MMSDVVDNSSLSNETKSFLRRSNVECVAALHNNNQNKVKVKEA